MGLIKQLNQEYQSKFISIREAFEAIKEVFPTSTEAEIAKLLIRAENDSLPHKAMLNGLTNEIISIEPSSDESLEYKDLLGKIIRMNLSLDDLENLDSSYFTFEVYPMEDPLWFDTRDLDNLGWYREGFNEALKKNGLDIGKPEQELPAWVTKLLLWDWVALDDPNDVSWAFDDGIEPKEFTVLSNENLKLLKELITAGKIELSPKVKEVFKAVGYQDAVSNAEINAELIKLKAENKKLKQQLEDSTQEELTAEPPAWFRPKHLMPYLSLNEAAFTIAFCEEIQNYREVSRDDVDNGFFGNIGQEAYWTLLRQEVEQGRISLSPNHGSYIDGDSYWQLNAMDIRRFCHEAGLKWPIPWEEEPEQQDGNQTAVNDPELNARLAKLKAANEALKAENEALKERLDNNLCINPDSELLPKEALVGLKAWIAVTNNGQEDVGFKKPPKQQILAKVKELIEQNPNQYCISNTGQERVGTVFNWKPEGGSPKTGK